jgi:hypothetical protein
MKKIFLAFVFFLSISPVLASDSYPSSDRFNLTYDDVNDMTILSDKITWGEGIPGTGDAFTGHSLYLSVQIKFQGKKYDPTDPNTVTNLIFMEMHDKSTDTNYLYEDDDTIALLIDGNRSKLGKAYYSQKVVGDDVVGKRLLETLSVKTNLSVLESISQAKQVKGSITAQNPTSSAPFTLGKNDIDLISKALDLLDKLKAKSESK